MAHVSPDMEAMDEAREVHEAEDELELTEFELHRPLRNLIVDDTKVVVGEHNTVIAAELLRFP